MAFLDDLRLVPTGRHAPDHGGGAGNPIWALAAPLRWHDVPWRTFTVPAGYETDLASIPQRFQRLAPQDSPAARPGVLHDWFYTTHAVPRGEADRIFREALAAEGVPLRQRLLMWAAVRAYGGAAYAARSGWAV
jgi:hypothetical protein